MKESIFDNKIYYRTNEFKEDRVTLVFVHGVCGSSSAWWEYEKKLNDKYNIVSYDIRGHGKSHRYEKYTDYEIDKFTNDLYELVNYLNIKKFIMISHSYGTFISLDFTSKHKEFVKALIFLSPNYDVLTMPQSKIAKPIFNLLTKINFPISQNKKREHLDYLKNYPNSGDYNLRRTIADVSNTGLRVYLYCMNQSFSFHGEPVLGKINIPVLIVHGKEDSIFPIKYGIEMAKKIPNAKIVMLDNVSHELKDSPVTIDKISGEIENFIKSII
jgi:pimeloyl-ACP methyl ester carboxylesterase